MGKGVFGFEKGNTLAAKSRKFTDLVERCLIQDDYKRLRQGIEKMMDAVAEGDHWAMEMVRDTIDGKPKQTVAIDPGLTAEERVSAFTAFIAEVAGLPEAGSVAGVGEERPVVPASIPPTAH